MDNRTIKYQFQSSPSRGECEDNYFEGELYDSVFAYFVTSRSVHIINGVRVFEICPRLQSTHCGKVVTNVQKCKYTATIEADMLTNELTIMSTIIYYLLHSGQ